MSRNLTKQIRRAMPAPSFAFKSEKTYSREWEEDDYDLALEDVLEADASSKDCDDQSKGRTWTLSN